MGVVSVSSIMLSMTAEIVSSREAAATDHYSHRADGENHESFHICHSLLEALDELPGSLGRLHLYERLIGDDILRHTLVVVALMPVVGIA